MSFNTSYVVNSEIGVKIKPNVSPIVRLHEGTIGASDGAVVSVDGYTTVLLQFRGSFQALIKMEGRVTSQSPWQEIAVQRTSDRLVTNTVESVGIYAMHVAGLKEIRASVKNFIGSYPLYVDATLSTEPYTFIESERNKVLLNWEHASVTSATTSPPFAVESDKIKVQVVKSQGMVRIDLQALEAVGYDNPRIVKSWYANNMPKEIDVTGNRRYALITRSGYRGADGIELEKVKVMVSEL